MGITVPDLKYVYREASEGAHRAESSTASTSPRSSTSDYARSKSSPRLHSKAFSTQEPNDPATASVYETHTRWVDHTMDMEGSASVSEIVESGNEPAAELLLHGDVQEDQEAPSPDGSVRVLFIPELVPTSGKIGPCLAVASTARSIDLGGRIIGMHHA